jgi:GntR family transcriptional regulator, transcriptional repressor for pyruvate dehydrogenase complex
MDDLLAPLHSVSLKDVFVERFEQLILSGRLPIGEQLPSERALAQQLNVSRPVVHDGLVDLAARGLVTTQPRVGTVVNDFRQQGSLALLTSLLGHGDPSLVRGLLDVRMLMESETARLAAIYRSDEDLAALRDVLERERAFGALSPEQLVAVDFDFHHRVALASGNPVYAMFMKSLQPAHAGLAGRFFVAIGDPAPIFAGHREVVRAIRKQDPDLARELMQELLDHGEQVVLRESS